LSVDISKINSDEDNQAKYSTISKVTAYPALTINEEYAGLTPPLSDSDCEALKQSIKQNGQHDPIVTNQDSIILDGHHRFRACEELKIESMVKLEAIESKRLEAGKMGAERSWKKGEANCANRNDTDRVGGHSQIAVVEKTPAGADRIRR
jgi:hypothetical protein